MGEYNNEKYPIASLKPKAETSVTSFLQKYTEYNGKDTIIDILGKNFKHITDIRGKINLQFIQKLQILVLIRTQMDCW